MPTLASLRDRILGRPAPSAPPPAERQLGYDTVMTEGNTGVMYGGSPGTSTDPPHPPRGFARGGGRVSTDSPWQFYGGYPFVLPPDEISENWRLINLDASTIRGMPTTRLLRVLADLSPDVSRSLWDFLRLVNPGWEVKATYPDTERPHPAAQKVLDQWTRSLETIYGSMDVVIGRLHFGAFLRGALMAELVLDEQGRMPVDLATPDPSTARYRRRIDPLRGQVWDLGQFQQTRWVLLDRPTIKYVPVDPAPGVPYGRSPSAPALFNSLFLLGMLGDLRRVVAQQGYPRYDLLIKLEQLALLAGPAVKSDPTAWKSFVDATVEAVSSAYNALEPDSAFVHTDMVEVKPPTGAVSADSLRGVSQLIEVLERQLARALKSMPLLMGMLEGSSEANANRQWEIQAAGVKSVQHLSESLLGALGTLVLEAQGIAAQCTWRFAELRAAELYRDAMTKALQVDNATKAYLMGWESQQTASLDATGHEPYLPEPLMVPRGMTPFGNATADGSVPERPGGSDNRPGKADNTGASPSEGAQESEETGERGRTRRDFLRLRWEDPVVPAWRQGGQRGKPEPMQPLGNPLPIVPADVRYDEGDRRLCQLSWDSAMPSAYDGMLAARIRDSEIERRWEAA
jgi:hypothetical protein